MRLPRTSTSVPPVYNREVQVRTGCGNCGLEYADFALMLAHRRTAPVSAHEHGRLLQRLLISASSGAWFSTIDGCENLSLTLDADKWSAIV